MTLYLGLSGWAYETWRGPFYPKSTPLNQMLAAYATYFTTVEINNTFYRTPTSAAISGWCSQVPPEFRFSCKAHRAITHKKRFADVTDFFDRYADLLLEFGTKLGPVLFQFETIADPPQLADFLGVVTGRFQRVVAEFRHPTWFSKETFAVLQAADVALCATETDEGSDPVVPTSFTYVRLRRSEYTAGEMSDRVIGLRRRAADQDVYAYAKHDAANAVLLRDNLA